MDTHALASLGDAIRCFVVFSHSVVSNSVTPRTVARQAPLSMEFSRQDYRNG